MTVPVIGLPYNVAPVVIVFWRVAIESIALIPYLAVRGEFAVLRATGARTRLALAVNGLLLAFHWFCFFSALTLTNVAVAELLTYTGPIYVAALTPLVLKERFERGVILPIAMALAGMGLVLGPGIAGLNGPSSTLGAVLAIIAALAFAFLLLNAKRLLRDLPTGVVMFAETAVATAALLPIALVIPHPGTAREWTAIAILGLVHSGLFAFIFLWGLRKVRADHAAVLMYLEPISAIFIAALFLGESLTLAMVAGGALVITGGALVARQARVPSVEGPFSELRDEVS